MTQQFSHPRLGQPIPNVRNPRRANTKTRVEVEDMLREIAFILKMTKQIHDEMALDSDAETREPALV